MNIENINLSNARQKVDSSYAVLKKLSLIKHKRDFILINAAKKNLNDYIEKYNLLAEKYRSNLQLSTIPHYSLPSFDRGNEKLSDSTTSAFLKGAKSPLLSTTSDLFGQFVMPKEEAEINFRLLFNGKILSGLNLLIKNYPFGLPIDKNLNGSYSLTSGMYRISVDGGKYKIAQIISSISEISSSYDFNPAFKINSETGLANPNGTNSLFLSTSSTNYTDYFTKNILSVNPVRSKKATVDLILESTASEN